MLLFVITSLQGATPTPLFYKFFYNDDLSRPEISEPDQRGSPKSKKIKLLRVVERLHSVYQFHVATNSNTKNQELEMQLLNSDAVVPEFDIGHFKLYSGDPFKSEMRVIWTSVNSLGIAFVCNSYENSVQAEITLRVLVRKLHESCRCIMQPSEILSKPEKVEILLSKFVPHGNLLLMNHRVIRQLEKESESLLKTVIT